MSVAGNAQYAFVIETRDNLSRTWRWISDYGDADGVAAGRGVEDDVTVSPRAFARATLDAYLDHMVAASSEEVDYYLYEDGEDIEWRIRVWDIYATGYDQISTVPQPGDRVRRNYPLAMMADKIEPASIVTLPSRVVRDRLRVKQAARTVALGGGRNPLGRARRLTMSGKCWADRSGALTNPQIASLYG